MKRTFQKTVNSGGLIRYWTLEPTEFGVKASATDSTRFNSVTNIKFLSVDDLAKTLISYGYTETTESK